MPIYLWRCERCGREAEVVRPIAESEMPPGDVPAQGPDAAGGACEHAGSWTKQVARTQPHQRAPGFGKKGHWLAAFLLVGLHAFRR